MSKAKIITMTYYYCPVCCVRHRIYYVCVVRAHKFVIWNGTVWRSTFSTPVLNDKRRFTSFFLFFYYLLDRIFFFSVFIFDEFNVVVGSLSCCARYCNFYTFTFITAAMTTYSALMSAHKKANEKHPHQLLTIDRGGEGK